MKRRILTAVAALLCTITVFSAAIAPAMASQVLTEIDEPVVQAEEFRWYYRTHNGEEQMRLWSITYGEWVTDWIPVPDDWLKS